MIEIRFHGRGGQGAVVASKVLAVALFLEGRYVQSFPAFGAERRGAPVAAFIRVDRDPILDRSQIYAPDHVVVLDPTLIEATDVTAGLKAGGWVIINSPLPPEGTPGLEAFRVATVDAGRIAAGHGLGSPFAPIVNTAILGAFARATGLVEPGSLEKAILDQVPVSAQANAAACREAFESTRTIQRKSP